MKRLAADVEQVTGWGNYFEAVAQAFYALCETLAKLNALKFEEVRMLCGPFLALGFLCDHCGFVSARCLFLFERYACSCLVGSCVHRHVLIFPLVPLCFDSQEFCVSVRAWLKQEVGQLLPVFQGREDRTLERDISAVFTQVGQRSSCWTRSAFPC